MDGQPDGRLSERLEAIYETYDDFDFQQTTVSVGDEEFDDVLERGDVTAVRVRVRGPEGILAVSTDGGLDVPGGVVPDDRSLSAFATDVVRERTGVDCRIDGVDRIDLAGLTHEETGETVYELSVRFVAEYESGSPTTDAEWQEALPERPLAF